jgi:ATPase subunit of ABC transporter with duplicated ATPase domains
MSAFLTLDSLSLATPEGDPLFSGLTLSLGTERVGLVGRNGSGKSTLLKALSGEVSPASGAIHMQGRIARLEQRFDEDFSVARTLGVDASLSRLARIIAGNGRTADFEAADWTLETRLEQALTRTGLEDIDLDRSMASLSGGERTRVGLARLLLLDPDIILLDEPTNNLDARGRAAVMQLVETWHGGLIVASHDRALLERMNRIVELSPIGCTVFGGGWTEFTEARDAARARAARDAEAAANKLRSTERNAQRARERKDRSDARGRAVRARRDQPKILLDARAERAEGSAARGQHLASRQLGEASDALADAEARLERTTPLNIDLPACELPAGRQILDLEAVSMTFGGRRLFGPLSFQLRGPARAAICGLNGSGKTTLLKLVTGEFQATSGTVSLQTGRIAFLDQHASALDPSLTLQENMKALAPGLSDNEARAQLARFAFRGGDALQLAGSLSGGERLRAALAAAFASQEPPELLLLDEPTNHLDMDAVDLLEAALKSYDGAILAISHDERFLEAIGIDQRIRLAREDRLDF